MLTSKEHKANIVLHTYIHTYIHTHTHTDMVSCTVNESREKHSVFRKGRKMTKTLLVQDSLVYYQHQHTGEKKGLGGSYGSR